MQETMKRRSNFALGYSAYNLFIELKLGSRETENDQVSRRSLLRMPKSRDRIWEHFIEQFTEGKRHPINTCRYCDFSISGRSLERVRNHLVKCKYLPDQAKAELPKSSLDDEKSNAESALVESSLRNWKECRWDDVGLDRSILGIPMDKIKARDLRTVCSALKLTGVNKAQKDKLIARIVEYKGINCASTEQAIKKQKVSPKEAFLFANAREQREREVHQMQLNEHLLKMEEKKQQLKTKQYECTLAKWTRIRETIKQLREDLKNETDEKVAQELIVDIGKFQEIKEKLVAELRIDV